ncbi:MAG: hypothetical protein KGS09_16220 [Nitrospirae bacterium]|nr:hypothetical protein [Nitrospirota bacterium]
MDDILALLNKHGPTSHQSQNLLERLGRRVANISSAILMRGPVVVLRLLFALLSLIFLVAPVYAQSPCLECLTAAEEELKKCLDNAIGARDKISCDESRQAAMKACVNGECKIERDEREKRETRNEQLTPNRPGLTPYTPTKIEWLALTMRASLRQNASTDSPYSLDIIPVDHETLLIVVRYHPTVNREMMNRTIVTAREVIMSTATSYGWDKWVKIRERVEMYPSPK